MFTIEIKTENAAFEGSACRQELARILREIAAHIEEQGTVWNGGNVYDVNGNKVGRWEVN